MAANIKKRPMRTVDEVYAWLLERKVVGVEEMTRYSERRFGAGYRYFHKQYVQPFLAAGKLLRVRRGLYAVINIFGDAGDPDRYLVASGIRERYYLGYHTALEMHGCAYSAPGSCQVAVARDGYFRPFQFAGVGYVPVTQKDLVTGVDTVRRSGRTIRLSGPSRTFVDCLRRPGLCGGLEECLKSLDGLRGVTLAGVDRALGVYGEDLLLRKAGFVLELMRGVSPYYGGLRVSELDRLAERVGKSPLYMEPGTPSERSERWNLYVPAGIQDLIRGV